MWDRNYYNAYKSYPNWVATILGASEKAGVFTRGIESDRKQRGTSINIDVFGFDEISQTIVAQIRECVFHPRRFNRVRKDYYLIGYTEQNNIFAHPVPTPAHSKKALSSPEATVRFSLSKIWKCKEEDLCDIIRQGDIAFVPAHLPEEAILLPETEITIRDSHKIKAKKIYQHGKDYYVFQAKARHTKNQHTPIEAKIGCYKVQPGIRFKVWGFSTPTRD